MLRKSENDLNTKQMIQSSEISEIKEDNAEGALSAICTVQKLLFSAKELNFSLQVFKLKTFNVFRNIAKTRYFFVA